MTEKFKPIPGITVAMVGHLAIRVPELLTVLDRSVNENNCEILPYIVLSDYTHRALGDDDVLDRYVTELESVLFEHAGHELDLPKQPGVSPLWSLVNAGFVQIIDPTTAQGQRIRQTYGPCLRVIDTIVRHRRGDVPVLD